MLFSCNVLYFKVEPVENDTEVLLELLSKDISCNHILSTMAAVQGPWSFIYWQVT